MMQKWHRDISGVSGMIWPPQECLAIAGRRVGSMVG